MLSLQPLADEHCHGNMCMIPSSQCSSILFQPAVHTMVCERCQRHHDLGLLVLDLFKAEPTKDQEPMRVCEGCILVGSAGAAV